MLWKRPLPVRAKGRFWLLVGLLLAATSLLVFLRNDLLLSYRISAARSAIRRHDSADALQILRKSAPRGELSAEWHFLMGCAHRKEGRLGAAGTHFSKAALLGFDDKALELQKLLVVAQSGHVKEVEPKLQKLLQEGVTDEEGEAIYDSLARSYLKSLFFSDAQRCLDFWVRWQPENPLPHLYLAELHRRLEEPQAAIQDYQKVLQLDPSNPQGTLGLARLELERFELEEAAHHFRSYLEARPNSPEALLGLAECERHDGRFPAALSHYYDALVLDLFREQEAEALANIGRMALEQSDYPRALHLLEHSVSIDPRQPASRLSLAAALTAIGEEDRAKEAREAARRLSRQQNRLLEITRNSIAQPNNADLRAEAGDLLFEEGFPADAARWYLSALHIDSNHLAAHRGLAKYYQRIGALDKSRGHQLIAARLKPEKADSGTNDGKELPE